MINSVELLAQSQLLPESRSLPYQLLWRQGQLLVSGRPILKQPPFTALHQEQRLVDCLKNSPVRLVRLDASLGESALTQWAHACQQAKKSVYLWLPLRTSLLKPKSLLSHPFIKFLEWLLVLSFTIVLSPLILGLAIAIGLTSPGPVLHRSWSVGQRGKLFQALQFRTFDLDHPTHTTPWGQWLDRTHLSKLPYLFNVIRGDISFMDAYHLSLNEALKLHT